MIPHSLTADSFKLQLGDALKLHAKKVRAIRVAKNENVYNSGDLSENLYFIESGHIKLVMFSHAGKECLLAIYSAGDIFGEPCLSGLRRRRETAIAMEETVLKKISRSTFFSHLITDSLLEGFAIYLALRISDQHDMLNDLVTIGSEQRLGMTLLRLAEKSNERNPRNIKFSYKITHEELSAMVGTTRPRISKFMRRFRKLGLIGLSSERQIIVKEKNLSDYLDKFDRS